MSRLVLLNRDCKILQAEKRIVCQTVALVRIDFEHPSTEGHVPGAKVRLGLLTCIKYHPGVRRREPHVDYSDWLVRY
jgi:hypothetical protein